MELTVHSVLETKQFADLVGQCLHGGEVLELVGDVGSGKTTFTKGLAEGLGVEDDVQSPSFTISRFYKGRDGLELHHYDFYRLTDPGIMRYDIMESTGDSQAVTVVEWAATVVNILPEERMIVHCLYGSDDTERTIRVEQPTKELETAYAAWTQDR